MQAQNKDKHYQITCNDDITKIYYVFGCKQPITNLSIQNMENILLNLSVKMNGYSGDWRAAIDEAYTLSKLLNVGCILKYANQYSFKILPTMTQDEINKIKEIEIVIAL
jgi:hypothetical protein